jgi:DnaK suppressor protein
MPSKKPNKVAKKPAPRVAKKASTPKVVAAKTVVRPSPSPTHKAKVKSTKTVSKASSKPVAKPTPVKAVAQPKPAPAPKTVAPPKAAAPKPVQDKPVDKSADKSAQIKFDPRPMVVSRPAPLEDDSDSDGPIPASLLAGPRNVKPYISKRGEQYMNKEQLEHFGRILQNWKRDLMVEVDRTVLHMKDEAANFPDPNDRATQEEEFSLELRTRDRERKLIRKIDEALKRIEDGSYGYCLETGEEIGIKRLEARPVATLSVEAQERRERREKQYGDRDDRYR